MCRDILKWAKKIHKTNQKYFLLNMREVLNNQEFVTSSFYFSSNCGIFKYLLLICKSCLNMFLETNQYWAMRVSFLAQGTNWSLLMGFTLMPNRYPTSQTGCTKLTFYLGFDAKVKAVSYISRYEIQGNEWIIT